MAHLELVLLAKKETSPYYAIKKVQQVPPFASCVLVLVCICVREHVRMRAFFHHHFIVVSPIALAGGI